MKNARMACLVLAAMGGMAGCFETTGGGTAQTFDLTYCDTVAECGADFECSPVYCADKCVPDGQGKCATCNAGKFGKCMPKPQATCGDVTCTAGEECRTMCTGACYAPASVGADAGKCVDVACEVVCVPVVVKCAADADCGTGSHCEKLCATGCVSTGTAGTGTSNADRAGLWAPPACPDTDCYGTCVTDPPAPVKCNAAADCPDGQVCAPIYCATPATGAARADTAMPCYPDASGGCGTPLPCNDGFLGQCVPKPADGCQSDADCPAGDQCQVSCSGECGAGRECASQCTGQCVAKQGGCQADADCGTGYLCQQMCVDCATARAGASGEAGAPAVDCGGGCYGQCVPVVVEAKCNADADCGAGAHCQVVFCTMACAVPADGSQPTNCLPCNDGYLGVCAPDATGGCKTDAECAAGQTCQSSCTGVCDPTTGCSNVCTGTCVTAQAGCQADADCAAGQVCQALCPPCVGATDPASGMPVMPCDVACRGQCVTKPSTCDAATPCPAGQACQQQAVCPACVYANPACQAACTVESQCVPMPTAGCQADADCQAWQTCVVACPVTCTPQGCTQACQGSCNDKPD